jgi:hypothetical protein
MGLELYFPIKEVAMVIYHEFIFFMLYQIRNQELIFIFYLLVGFPGWHFLEILWLFIFLVFYIGFIPVHSIVAMVS